MVFMSALLILVPFFAGLYVVNLAMMLSVLGGIVFASTTFVSALLAMAVVISLLLVAIDPLIWRLISRPAYAAARFGVLNRKKTLLSVAALMWASAFSSYGRDPREAREGSHLRVVGQFDSY
jgi:hypothetical protein